MSIGTLNDEPALTTRALGEPFFLHGHCLHALVSVSQGLGWKACTATPSCILSAYSLTGCSRRTKWHQFVFSISQYFGSVLYTVGFYLRLISLSCDKIVQISSWLSFLEGVGNEGMTSFWNFLLLKEQVSFFSFGCEQFRELEKSDNSSHNKRHVPKTPLLSSRWQVRREWKSHCQ